MNWETIAWVWGILGVLNVVIEATKHGANSAAEYADAEVRGWKRDPVIATHKFVLHFISLVILAPVLTWMLIVAVAVRPRALRMAKEEDAKRRLAEAVDPGEMKADVDMSPNASAPRVPLPSGRASLASLLNKGGP